MFCDSYCRLTDLGKRIVRTSEIGHTEFVDRRLGSLPGKNGIIVPVMGERSVYKSFPEKARVSPAYSWRSKEICEFSLAEHR